MENSSSFSFHFLFYSGWEKKGRKKKDKEKSQNRETKEGEDGEEEEEEDEEEKRNEIAEEGKQPKRRLLCPVKEQRKTSGSKTLRSQQQ